MVDTELTAVDGTVLGSAQIDLTDEPHPRAVLSVAPDAPTADLAEAALAAMPGHRLIVEDPGLAEALMERGVTLVRASSLMVLPLPALSPGAPAPDIELGPLRDDPHEHAALIQRAYPPDHPDHEVAEATPEGAAETIRGYLSGEIVGPLLADASAEALIDGVLAGMNVVSEMPADHRFAGGPWITDICVDPAAQGRGVGRALLGHAIDRLSAAGEPILGLAVTVGNPARGLYDALGFVEQGTRWHLVNER